MVTDRDQLTELTRKAALGDSHAFRRLVTATTDLVYRVALRTVGTSADAEDVVQDTFVRAWQKLPTLNDPGAVAGWLCRIARNIGTDKLRARKNRPAVCRRSASSRSSRRSCRCRPSSARRSA